MINQNIFKSYDIRGIYPSELNEEAAFEIGRAFVKKTGAKRVAVGRDARLASPNLFKALARGIAAEGGKVYDIGQCPTECLYFAVSNYDFGAGIMVTASHNPKEYDGFKLVQRAGNNLKVISGKDLKSFVEEGDGFKKQSLANEEKKDIWPDFINHALSFAAISDINPFKIVVDASNGVGGLALSKMQDRLPVKIVPLNFEPNGNFPNHSPNPMLQESYEQISEEIIKQKADFGFVFDGDADRVFLIDENGKKISSDVTILLLAKYFLEKNPGGIIARHATCSKAIDEFVKKWGGIPLRTKVGFINIQQGLIDNNGIMGGELTGHYCFKDNSYSDSGMIAFLTLLQVISKDGRKVSEITKELAPYYKPDEINFEVKDKDAIIEKIKEKYKDGEQDFLDGITVSYNDWWFNVRPSNTEPLLRLTIEARTKEFWEQKQKELAALIKA